METKREDGQKTNTGQSQQNFKVGPVFHISEEEFRGDKLEQVSRTNLAGVDLPAWLPPMPDLIPLEPRLEEPEVTSWLVEELESLMECPVCSEQIICPPVPSCPRGHLLCPRCWRRCEVCPVCQYPWHHPAPPPLQSFSLLAGKVISSSPVFH